LPNLDDGDVIDAELIPAATTVDDQIDTAWRRAKARLVLAHRCGTL